MSNDETRIKVDAEVPAWALRAIDKARDQRLHAVSDGFTVGRSVDCDLVLHDSLASRNHACFHLRGHRLFVEDTSTNGTFINKTRVDQSEVRHGDVIAFDEVEYQVLISSDTQTPATRPPERGKRRGGSGGRQLPPTELNSNRGLNRGLGSVKMRDQYVEPEAREEDEGAPESARPTGEPPDPDRPTGRRSMIAEAAEQPLDPSSPEAPADELKAEPESEPEAAEAPPRQSTDNRVTPPSGSSAGGLEGLLKKFNITVPVAHVRMFLIVSSLVLVPLIGYELYRSSIGSGGMLDESEEAWVRRVERGNNHVSMDAVDLYGDPQREIAVTTADGKLLIVNPSTGMDIASVELPDKAVVPPLIIPKSGRGVGFVIVATSQNYLLGYDGTAQYLWSSDIGRASRGVNQPAVKMSSDPGLAVLGTRSGGIVLFNALTGEILGDSTGLNFRNTSTNLHTIFRGDSDDIYVADNDGKIAAFTVRSSRIDPKWEASIQSIGNPQFITSSGRTLVTSTTTGDMFAHDVDSGEQLWHSRLNTSISAAHIVVKDQIAAFDIRGVMYLVSLSDGSIDEEINIGDSVAATPHLHNNQLLLSDSGGAIKAIDLGGKMATRIYVTGADAYRGKSLAGRFDEDSPVSIIAISQNGVLSRVDFH